MLLTSVLALGALAGLAHARRPVQIHPGDQDSCVTADGASDREQLSASRCSSQSDSVTLWEVTRTDPTVIRLSETNLCLTGGVHRNLDGTLVFDPESGDHAVMRPCPEGHLIPEGFAWVRTENDDGVAFRLDLQETWYLHAPPGAAVHIIKDRPPQHGWHLEKIHRDDGGDDDNDDVDSGSVAGAAADILEQLLL